jgi:hypothetical protein
LATEYGSILTPRVVVASGLPSSQFGDSEWQENGIKA